MIRGLAVGIALTVAGLSVGLAASLSWSPRSLGAARLSVPRCTSAGFGVVNNLTGANVVSVNKERIGKVANLILNDDGKVEAAVIKIGGFMGFGGKTVAVTYDSLNISRNRKGDAIDRVTVAATRDDLLRATSFKSLRQQLAEVQEKR